MRTKQLLLLKTINAQKNNVNGRAQIYRVKANIQTGNIRVKVMTTQKGQSPKILTKGSQKFTHFSGKFNRGSRRVHCWGYASVFKNKLEKLISKSICPLNLLL